MYSSPVMNFVKIAIRITEILDRLPQATNLFSLQMGKYNTYASFWKIVVGVGRSSLVSVENRYCFNNQKIIKCWDYPASRKQKLEWLAVVWSRKFLVLVVVYVHFLLESLHYRETERSAANALDYILNYSRKSTLPSAPPPMKSFLVYTL